MRFASRTAIRPRISGTDREAAATRELSTTRGNKEKAMTDLQAGKIEELKRGFEGEILLPSDGAYESARKIWNAMIDKRPAVIARCATTSDVVSGVKFAKDNGLLLAVRGGGHNIAGNATCDDG